jgi:acyl carrier protein
MKQKIAEIISVILDIPVNEINEDISRENTAVWDSLKHIQIITALEEEFDVEFEDEEIEAMTDMKKLVKKMILKNGSNKDQKE